MANYEGLCLQLISLMYCCVRTFMSLFFSVKLDEFANL